MECTSANMFRDFQSLAVPLSLRKSHMWSLIQSQFSDGFSDLSHTVDSTAVWLDLLPTALRVISRGWSLTRHWNIPISSWHIRLEVSGGEKSILHGENTQMVLTSAVNQIRFLVIKLFFFNCIHLNRLPSIKPVLKYWLSNHQGPVLQSCSTIALCLKGNESAEFSFCWAHDFPTLLKKETESQDKREVMTVSLLYSKLSLPGSASAASFEWISTECYPFLTVLALPGLAVLIGIAERVQTRHSYPLLIYRWLSCRVVQCIQAQGRHLAF